MFRLRVTADTFTTVFVMPRRLSLDRSGSHAASDVNTSSILTLSGIDRAELSDIREYRNGDHIKASTGTCRPKLRTLSSRNTR